jgi:hypothetical protein
MPLEGKIVNNLSRQSDDRRPPFLLKDETLGHLKILCLKLLSGSIYYIL